MSLREFLSQDVSDLFSRRTPDGASPVSASSPQAHLDITRSAAKLEFLCTHPPMRFFSLDAHLSGNLETSRSLSEDKVPTTRVEIPLDASGQKRTIVLLYCCEAENQDWPLAEATVVALHDGSRALRFAFGDDKDRILYKFVLPSDVQVQDFQPLERQRQTIFTAPSVGQVAAMLRTTLKDRRDAFSALEDLGSVLSPGTIKRIAGLRGQLPARSSLQTPSVALLVEYLAAQSEGGRRAPNPQLVAALCLLLDLEAGKLADADIESFARGTQPLHTSFSALATVASHFGASLSPDLWKTKLERAGAVYRAGDDAAPERMAEAMRRLAERMGRPRDALQVLTNLVRESPSPRVEAMVRLWTERSDARPGAVEGLQALSDLIAAHGKRMDPGTLNAFCLYAEIESAGVGEKRFIDWLEGRRAFVLSPYTMQAVAIALDIPLTGFSLSATQRLSGDLYAALFGISPAGVMQRLEAVDAAGNASNLEDAAWSYRFLSEPCAADQKVDGFRPSGELMLVVSMLERLTERELNLFLRLGNRFYACFQSDLDRRRVWKLLGPELLEANSPFTFIDGFRVFHFQGSVLAEVRPSSETAASQGKTPLVCKDHRNSLHFFHPEEPPPKGGVMQDAESIVHFPPTAQLPPIVAEMGVEMLLGRVEAGASDVRKLELLRKGLRTVLTAREDFGPALSPQALQHLRERLAAPRVQQTLRRVIDPRTQEFLEQQFMDASTPRLELRPVEPLTRGLRDNDLLEFTALALVYELCISNLTESRGFRKNFRKTVFRAALRDHLMHILDADSPTVKAVGCRLLSTAPCIGDASERGIVEYELLRRLEETDDSIAYEAGAALGRIALEEDLGLPAIFQVRQPEATNQTATAQNERTRTATAVAGEIRAWQIRLSSMLSREPVGTSAAASTARIPMTPPAPTGVLKEIATLVAGVRCALTIERAERGSMIVLTNLQGLDKMLRGFLGSFADYADASRLSLAEVTREIAGRGLSGYLAFATRQQGADAMRRVDDTGEETTFETFQYEAMCKPVPFWIEKESDGGRRVSPLFMAVLRRAMEGPVAALRIALLSDAGSAASRTGSGEERAGAVPVPLRMQVYNSTRGEFISLVEEMLPAAQFTFSPREQALLAALATVKPVAAERDKGESERAIGESERDEPSAAELVAAPRAGPDDGHHAPTRPIVIEQEKPEVVLRARHVLEAFALPQTYLLQVLYVFQETRAASVYDFF